MINQEDMTKLIYIILIANNLQKRPNSTTTKQCSNFKLTAKLATETFFKNDEKNLTITQKQFEDAWSKTFNELKNIDSWSGIYAFLVKELGFN